MGNLLGLATLASDGLFGNLGLLGGWLFGDWAGSLCLGGASLGTDWSRRSSGDVGQRSVVDNPLGWSLCFWLLGDSLADTAGLLAALAGRSGGTLAG